MNLQDKLLSSYLAFQENLDISNPMSELRDKAIRNFEVQGFPTKKEENWKYTSLNSIIKNDFSLTPSKEDTIEFKDVKKYFIHDLDTYNIVFIDGVYSSYLSETTHDGVDICLLSSALNKAKYKPVIDVYYNKIARENSLTSLNTAFAKEGAYI
ncbi:hypothetical protein LCGC14_2941810, partial [marine sediment metagenome]